MTLGIDDNDVAFIFYSSLKLPRSFDVGRAEGIIYAYQTWERVMGPQVVPSYMKRIK